jgi:hypothetical protein
VRHRSIHSLSGGMFIVHREFVEQLLALTKSFYAFCKQNGCSLSDEPLLAYAMHLVCGDPSRHLLARHPDLWGTDWEGRFKERLPDGEPWPLRSPFAETELTVNPAIVHLIRRRAKVLSWCDQSWKGVCDQSWNNGLALLRARSCSVVSRVASAEDRALRGRNPSAA